MKWIGLPQTITNPRTHEPILVNIKDSDESLFKLFNHSENRLVDKSQPRWRSGNVCVPVIEVLGFDYSIGL